MKICMNWQKSEKKSQGFWLPEKQWQKKLSTSTWEKCHNFGSIDDINFIVSEFFFLNILLSVKKTNESFILIFNFHLKYLVTGPETLSFYVTIYVIKCIDIKLNRQFKVLTFCSYNAADTAAYNWGVSN